MQEDEYRERLNLLSAKFDKNPSVKYENLTNFSHKMFVEGAETQKLFKETYDAIENEVKALEKVELTDFWNGENGHNY